LGLAKKFELMKQELELSGIIREEAGARHEWPVAQIVVVGIKPALLCSERDAIRLRPSEEVMWNGEAAARSQLRRRKTLLVSVAPVIAIASSSIVVIHGSHATVGIVSKSVR
jgi:hypothetical protein